MKILYVINSLRTGGAERLIATVTPLLNNLPNIELEMLLLTDGDSIFMENLYELGIIIHFSPYKMYNILNVLFIRNLIMKKHYDIVHAHLFPTSYWVALAKTIVFKRKTNFIFTEHSTFNKRRKYKILLPFEKFIYSKYSYITSISEATNTNLLRWIKPKKKDIEKFVIIENGIDIEKYSKAIPYCKKEISYLIQESCILICMVGRFSIQKDQKTLIRAVKELPNEYVLILVGGGPLMNEIKYYVQSLDLEKRVFFLGIRGDIERIFKSSNIVVLSSFWEGFGLAAIEGMAAEKPVIATRVSGLSDVVGESGYLFNVGDYKTLAKLILQLGKNPIEYNKIIEINKKIVQKYSISRMVDQWMSIYKSLLQ